jgi:hypothetical protein
MGSLVVQPLSKEAELKEQLKIRGRQFVARKGRHHLDYEGPIFMKVESSSRDIMGPRTKLLHYPVILSQRWLILGNREGNGRLLVLYEDEPRL